VAFALLCAGLPVWWCVGLAILLTVPVPHLIERIVEAQPFNVRDTVFDSLTAATFLAPAAVRAFPGVRGWLVCAAWFVVAITLYFALVARHWNSP
jgi:hypothetical protein